MASIRVSKIEQDQMHSAHRNKAALVAFEHQADQWMSILGFHPEKNGRSNIRRFWMSFPPSNSMALHRVSIPTGFFFLFFFFFLLFCYCVQRPMCSFRHQKKKPLFFLLHSPCKSVRSGKVTPRAQLNYFCLLLKKQLEVAEEEEKKKRDKQTAAILYQEHKKKDEKRKKKMLKDKKKTYIYIYIYIYNRKEKQLYVASKMVKEKRVMNRAVSLSDEAESRSCDSEGVKKKKSLDLRSCAQVTIRS